MSEVRFLFRFLLSYRGACLDWNGVLPGLLFSFLLLLSQGLRPFIFVKDSLSIFLTFQGWNLGRFHIFHIIFLLVAVSNWSFWC